MGTMTNALIVLAFLVAGLFAAALVRKAPSVLTGGSALLGTGLVATLVGAVALAA
jgi:hypothetical protein